MTQSTEQAQKEYEQTTKVDWAENIVDRKRPEPEMGPPTSEAHAAALKPGAAEREPWRDKLKAAEKYTPPTVER